MTINYTGNGDFFWGIPARDLTDDEFAALSEEVQQALLDSGFYTLATTTAPPKAAKVDPSPSPVITSG